MVAALNGIFDIYADETAPWDVEVFRKGNFLEGLKGCVSKVRAIVSTKTTRNVFLPCVRVSEVLALSLLRGGTEREIRF